MDEEKIREQIRAVREEIVSTPHHKGTDHHLGRLRAKIARLEDQLLTRSGGGHGGGSGYAVAKSGDATVVLVGFPSVGKSTLLNQLTRANSKTAQYPFTTLTVVPGMMAYRGAKIQIMDVPGLISGAAKGRGRGKEVLSVVRVADLILLLIDPDDLNQIQIIMTELNGAGIRLGQDPPRIIIHKKTKGGIIIKNQSALFGLSVEEARGIIEELGIKNAEIVLDSQKTSADQLIDAILGNRAYIPYQIVISKADTLDETARKRINRRFPRAIFVSPLTGQGLDDFKMTIFSLLKLKRVYLKSAQGIDFDQPLIMKKEATVTDVAFQVGQILTAQKSAHVWGKSAKFPGQLVSNRHVLLDEDIVAFS
jgi:hypothetical protein